MFAAIFASGAEPHEGSLPSFSAVRLLLSSNPMCDSLQLMAWVYCSKASSKCSLQNAAIQ